MNYIKIILTGDTEVGKTNFLIQFIDNKFQEKFIPTIGIDLKVKNIKINEKIYKFQILDISGNNRFKGIEKKFYENINFVFLIYDITKKNTFESIKNYWYETSKKNGNKEIKFIVIGNKNDLKEKRQISFEEGKKYSMSINAFFFELNTKYLNKEINEIFIFIALYNNELSEIRTNFIKLKKEGKKIEEIENQNFKYEGIIINKKKEEYGIINYNNGEKFIGQFKNDKKEGEGTIININYDIIKSNWKKDISVNFGIILYRNGSIYIGNFINTNNNIYLKEGLGIIKYINGDRFEGEFKNDLKEGKGKLYLKDKIIIGFWLNDKMTNNGIINYNNGDYYEGNIIKNKREGEGIIKYNNGNIFKGSFINDIINGKGKLYNEQSTYEGDFNNNQKNGIGRITFNNNEFYEGEFINDKMEGKGIYFFKNKRIFHGSFINNLPDKGKLLFSHSDNVYEGQIDKNGLRKGEGKIIYTNKKNIIYMGNWVDDKKKGKGILFYSERDYNIIIQNKKLIEEFPINIFKLNFTHSFYYGNFDNNLKNDYGILFTYKNEKNPFYNKTIYVGNFKNDIKFGRGYLFFKEGSFFKGFFNDNIDNEKEGTFYLNDNIQFTRKNFYDWENFIRSKKQVFRNIKKNPSKKCQTR